MKLDTKLLTPAVNFMKNFTADRDIIPAYRHFYFSEDSLRAYSGTFGAVYYGLWPKKGFPQPFSLPAESLVKILSTLADQSVDEVDFSEVKNGRMVVKGGRFKSTMPVLQGDELKDFLTPKPKTKSQEVVLDWWKDVERLLFSVCKDETNPSLRGLYISPTGTLAASDNYRISILRPNSDSFKPEKALLIPEYLLSRLGARRSIVQAIFVEENRLWFNLESALVYGVKLESEFPASRIATVLKETQAATKDKKSGGTWITLQPDGSLSLILSRLAYFADSMSCKFTVTVETKSILIQVGGEDGEPAAEEVIPAKIDGPGGTFNVNGNYFAEACSVGSMFWFAPEPLTRPLYFQSPDKRLDHLVRRLA